MLDLIGFSPGSYANEDGSSEWWVVIDGKRYWQKVGRGGIVTDASDKKLIGTRVLAPALTEEQHRKRNKKFLEGIKRRKELANETNR